MFVLCLKRKIQIHFILNFMIAQEYYESSVLLSETLTQQKNTHFVSLETC